MDSAFEVGMGAEWVLDEVSLQWYCGWGSLVRVDSTFEMGMEGGGVFDEVGSRDWG